MSPVLQPTLSKDMEEKLKLVHKMIDIVDPQTEKLCETTAIQGGQSRNLLRSSSSIRIEEGGGEISANCLSQI